MKRKPFPLFLCAFYAVLIVIVGVVVTVAFLAHSLKRSNEGDNQRALKKAYLEAPPLEE